jgi:hypothetical protein
MTSRTPKPEYVSGKKITHSDYAAGLLKDVSREELALFAAEICAKVTEFRVIEGQTDSPLTSSTVEITSPLLLRTLELLDKRVYGKQASLNAQPGKTRLPYALQIVTRLHQEHRKEYSTRAAFVRFAEGQIDQSGCPQTRTINAWVKVMDEQSAG